MSLYHLKLLMSTTPTAHQRTRCSTARNVDPLHEPVEIEQLRLRIAVGLLGEVRDDVLEEARDGADGDVLLGELQLQPLHLGGESLGERANRVVLRLFEELALASDDLLDFLKELRLQIRIERDLFMNPVPELGGRTRTFPHLGSEPAVESRQLGHGYAGHVLIKSRAAPRMEPRRGRLATILRAYR